MAKMYFSDIDDEMCYPLEIIKGMAAEEGLTTINIYPAKADFGSGAFYCHFHNAIGKRNDYTCGSVCEHYKPRNGKSVICIELGHVYEADLSKKRTIKIKK